MESTIIKSTFPSIESHNVFKKNLMEEGTLKTNKLIPNKIYSKSVKRGLKLMDNLPNFVVNNEFYKNDYTNLTSNQLKEVLSKKLTNIKMMDTNQAIITHLILDNKLSLLKEKLTIKINTEKKVKRKEPLKDKKPTISEMFKSKLYRVKVDAALSKAFYLQKKMNMSRYHN